MRILNFGSLNIDHVYSLDHFVRPGETTSSSDYSIFPGGKGANQSMALALAGADVAHAGKIGTDGVWYRDKLADNGVDVSRVAVVDSPSGHAIIQVNGQGENAIILFGGANQEITDQDAERAIEGFAEGDYLLLQNEISAIPAIMKCAHERGLTIVLNPAPMDKAVLDYPLDLVGVFIVNEIEGAEISGETEPQAVLDAMVAKFPGATIVLTLGSKGVRYARGKERLSLDATEVAVVDTTAAGDTFIGYFLAELASGSTAEEALKMGCRAAEVCVTRKGATSSIPRRNELTDRLLSRKA